MSPIFQKSFKFILLASGFMLGVMLSNLFIGSLLRSNNIGGVFRNSQTNVVTFAPTSTSSLVPSSDNTSSFGSPAYRWANGFFAGTVYSATGFSVPSGVASSTLPNILMTNGGNVWASSTKNMTFLVTSTVAGNGPGFTFDTSDGRGTDKNGGNFTIKFGNSTGAGAPGALDLYTRSGGSEFQIGTIGQLSERSWGLINGSSNYYYDIGGFFSGGGDWIYGSRFFPAGAVNTTSTVYTGTLGQTKGQICVADSDGSGFTCMAGNNGTMYMFSTSTL
ncbi:MAG TPA: hypothetical protein PK720_04455 [bacterium]|nr:hypothetical protein [bacterium]